MQKARHDTRIHFFSTLLVGLRRSPLLDGVDRGGAIAEDLGQPERPGRVPGSQRTFGASMEDIADPEPTDESEPGLVTRGSGVKVPDTARLGRRIHGAEDMTEKARCRG